MDQLNLSDGEDLPQEILEKMKKMPVPDELLNFLGTFEQFGVKNKPSPFRHVLERSI